MVAQIYLKWLKRIFVQIISELRYKQFYVANKCPGREETRYCIKMEKGLKRQKNAKLPGCKESHFYSLPFGEAEASRAG